MYADILKGNNPIIHQRNTPEPRSNSEYITFSKPWVFFILLLFLRRYLWSRRRTRKRESYLRINIILYI